MNSRLKWTIAVGLAAATGAFAQMDVPPPSPGMGGMGGEPMGHMGGMPGGPGGKVVMGAPYSADISNQSVQTLPDGNTIARSTTGHTARDSQGRTYSQETITGGFIAANGPITVTFINDPVAGVSYMLNSSTKVAMKMTRPAGAGTKGDRGPRAGGVFPGGPGGMGHDGAGRDGVVPQTSDLGTQNVNGVSAQGKSTTRTIPAGTMGNTQPIVSTGETWYSPDLQVIVMAKRSDPRMGQSTYSLLNIQRGEPAASLFQVPADYTVQDAKRWGGGFPGGFQRGGGGPGQHSQQQ